MDLLPFLASVRPRGGGPHGAVGGGLHRPGTAWLVLFTALLGRLRPVLARAVVRRWIERVTGAVLLGLGVRLAVDA